MTMTCDGCCVTSRTRDSAARCGDGRVYAKNSVRVNHHDARISSKSKVVRAVSALCTC